MAGSERRFSSVDEILEAALRREEAAYRFYDGMLSNSRVEMVRELIERLRDEESKHIRLIEKRLVQLNLGRG